MNWPRAYILFCLALCAPSSLLSQENREIKAHETRESILIDGILTEDIWSRAERQDEFRQNFPFDTSLAQTQTVVMMAYDEQFIYIAAICHDGNEEPYVVQSLKRDFDFFTSDAFDVYIDPYSDKTNGWNFGVNPYGVQREGAIVNGGAFGVRQAWDNTWFVETTRSMDKWIVEMAIPFKTLRYTEGIDHWRINFARTDLKRNERSAWSHVPRNFDLASLAFTGILKWETPPPKPKKNVSLIPYALGSVSKDYEAQEPTKLEANAGMDAKIAVNSSLNLDLTLNPDFSQVDVDRQVTNLTRFSLFFPERRTFFLENDDLFGQLGFRQIRPFFSRRIGLHESGSKVPILGGARLTGKLNQNWRIGLMNIQTEGVRDLDLAGQNYAVGAIQKKIFDRSTITGIFVNRQAFSGNSVDFGDYNRVLGLDLNLASKSNKLRGKAFYHHSFSPNVQGNNYAHASWAMYFSPRLFVMWNHEYVGNNYLAEVGFVPRISNYNPETGQFVNRSYWRLEPMIGTTFYPKKGRVNNHGPELYLSEYMDSIFKSTERNLSFEYTVAFQNSADFRVNATSLFTRLFWDTDVTFTDQLPIPRGDYRNMETGFRYTSNRRKLITGSVGGNYGTYFNGHKVAVNFSLSYRAQPWGKFTIDYQRNTISLPEPYGSTVLNLIGPQIDLSFTRSLFFTAFLQYNTQAKNMNINTRFQWRFKPMSDVFIVYTDNYVSDVLAIKNRALVVKFVYWFNL